MECGAMECLTTQHISLHRSIYQVYLSLDLSGCGYLMLLTGLESICAGISTLGLTAPSSAIAAPQQWTQRKISSKFRVDRAGLRIFGVLNHSQAARKQQTNRWITSAWMVCIKMRRVRLASQTMVNDMVLLRFTEAISSCEWGQPSSLANALCRRKRSGICSRATPLVSWAVVSVSIPNGCEWICENYTCFQLLPKRNKSLM